MHPSNKRKTVHTKYRISLSISSDDNFAIEIRKSKFGSLWFRLIHQETYIHPKIYLYNQILVLNDV